MACVWKTSAVSFSASLGTYGVLERPRGNYDLVGGDLLVGDLEAEGCVAGAIELLDLAAELDRQLEDLGVALEVGDHLVLGRVAVWIAWKRQSRQRAVAAGREESQRLPTLTPSGRDRTGALEDPEPSPVALEEVADRQAGLAAADHGHLEVLRVVARAARARAH